MLASTNLNIVLWNFGVRTYAGGPLIQRVALWLGGVEDEAIFESTICKITLRKVANDDFADAANDDSNGLDDSADGGRAGLHHGEACQDGDDASEFVAHGDCWGSLSCWRRCDETREI